MLRLPKLLAASQLNQIAPCAAEVSKQLLPEAVSLTHQQQQQQQQQWPWGLPPSSCRHYCQASTSTQTSSSSSEEPVRYPTTHERRVANLKFCQERAAWRRQVKQLCVQWLQEYKAQRAVQKSKTEEVKQQIAELRQLRNEDKQHDRERHQLERLLLEAERAVETVRWCNRLRFGSDQAVARKSLPPGVLCSTAGTP